MPKTVLAELVRRGWCTADAAVANRYYSNPDYPWGGPVCWSNWELTDDAACGFAIVTLWVNLQPFLHAADPCVRELAVGAFVAAANVVAYG